MSSDMTGAMLEDLWHLIGESTHEGEKRGRGEETGIAGLQCCSPWHEDSATAGLESAVIVYVEYVCNPTKPWRD